jgi:hypothetical protein
MGAWRSKLSASLSCLFAVAKRATGTHYTGLEGGVLWSRQHLQTLPSSQSAYSYGMNTASSFSTK